MKAAVDNHVESSAVKQDTKKSATESGTKFSITEDMSEQERYEELKDKSIVISKPDMSKVSDIDIEAYKNLSTKEAKKPIRRIAEMLGIHNVNYKNSNIEFGFGFSKKNLDVSLHHQSEYGGDYADYVEMLTCLDKLVENSELIEIHKNYKNNEYLKNTFVLISAINNDGNIAPVQLEVKEYDKGQSNSLYLNVVLSKIKKSAVMKGKHNGNTDISNPLVADSAISLSQLFANVNPSDKRFLKYVPDNFLSTEQIEAKREAQKSDYKNYNRYVEVFKNDKDGGDNKFSLSETDRYDENINDIYGYKIKQGIKVNEDLLELLSVYDKNAKVDTNGNVTVYHRTNADVAEKIRKTGIMIAKEDALFFSSEDNGYASDYGDTVITLKIPSTVLEVNDVFDGEVHFDLPLRYKNGVYSLNVSQYLKDTDTKFSLSEPVEEKGNLIAVHNIYTDKLAKSLKLGGFPMPSIAVTKADMGHENYGECSFVFDKSTIDPKADKRNKVYGGDAWTPTYPNIDKFQSILFDIVFTY